MSQKFLAALLLLFVAPSNAAITLSMSVNKEPVCKIYKEAYTLKLSAGAKPIFNTDEIPSHSDGSTYTSDGSDVIPIEFSKPFTHEEVKWLEWLPIADFDHSFKWGGVSTNVTAIGSIKPSSGKSLVFQANTIGWRGPFHRVWLIDDNKLSSLLKSTPSNTEEIPIEGTGAKLIFPNFETRSRSNLTNVFKFKKDFYTVTNEQIVKVTTGNPEVVCQVGLESEFSSAQLSALVKAANSALMTKGITHIPMYYGTMGNPHQYVEDGFEEATNKPWLIQVAENGKCLANDKINNCEKNRKVEAVLESFAEIDPWSFREIKAIRHHIDGTKLVLSQYYIDKFKVDEVISKGMATQAIYNFLEKTVLLHPYIQNEVGKVKEAPNSYTLDEDDGTIPRNWFNKTSLMWAAHFNDYDAVMRLLSQGESLADVTNTNDHYPSIQLLNRSALTYAAENGSIPLIQALISRGADTNIKDSKGNEIKSYFQKNKLLDITWEELTSLPKAPIKASFDCKLARSKQEKAICNSKGLSLYDRQLGLLYKKVRASKLYPEIKTLQRTWLKSLRTECSGSGVKLQNCMKEKYRSRIKYLANLL
ncbi:ankyrin repeat domain-containing protein [Pseudoalteromonas obscura]|uniref:Ankyrin repeat domain-containing protein n=1 Tax=Pseudoalteromonas obscura TaxID=3048491 RepID=A0ABT7ENT6_9GAMM|nr:ankyrin repeat domain-containing protein [Pseudoalteromonas sp. P94(2023)]MDK2596714.1 ankyrin repeat domain-containing protein [Pseudoalteromonas sp. P94(2023)]